MKKSHRTVFQNAWSQKNNTFIESTQFCKFIWKKATEPSSKMPEAKKTNTLIEKTILFQKKLINSYGKNATEPSSKMPEAKKTNTLIKKNNSVPKKPMNSYEKKATEPSSKMPEAKKTNTLIEKTILFQKTYKFIWKNATEPSSKMPEAEKKQHVHWKKHSVPKKHINLYEKRPQNRLPKYLKPKKQTLSLKKQFCFKKAYKFIWKKATEPFSQMPESRETNTFIEKTILLFMVINSYERHRTVLQNAGSQKTKHSPWTYNSVWKKLKFIWKKATEPSSKMPEAKKTNSLIKKTIPFQKNLWIHMKKVHRTVFQKTWSQKNQHCNWKNNSVSKKLL